MSDDARHDPFTTDLGREDGFDTDLAGDGYETAEAVGTKTAAERAAVDERRDAGSGPRLGHVLREARERAGLGLSDVAGVTHVRRGYLDALEEGRYAELPEDVYTRNFLRLYAQAVSLDVDAVIDLYLRERRTALGLTTLEQRLERDRRTARSVSSSPTAPVGSRSAGPPPWLVGPWLPTIVLVAIVVGIGLWGFNQLFAAPSARQAASPPAAPSAAAPAATDAAATADAEPDVAAAESAAAAEGAAALGGLAAPSLGGPGGAASLAQVRVDVMTDPPGATVTIDGFPIPGRTPLTGIPITGRDGRVVRAELDGYEPAEIRADLSVDARVDLTLTPIGDETPEPSGAAAAGDGRIVLTVSDTTWLEVYRSTARNVGDRLVYTTAQSGATYAFDAPIYVYVGNASGVRITHGGQDLGPMGSPGAVLGRAFPE